MKKHIYIRGRVQGVGFRHFTKVNARKLGVNGWVRNRPDGSVEALFDGDEEAVKELIGRCKEGPSAGYVQDMEVTEAEDPKEYDSFKVRFF